MTNQKNTQRIIVPRPERIRSPSQSGYGWLDARLHRQGWLELLSPEDIAVYTFLCLVANRQGVSWYRRDRIQKSLCINETDLWQALERLYELDIVAYHPFSKYASNGFHQVLSLPLNAPQ
jgi:hypothetical protein